MDCLLANYASDEDDVHEETPPPPHKSTESPSLSLAILEEEVNVRPNSTSERGDIFKSVPPPKYSMRTSSTLFSVLPQPKSFSSAPKRVVHIRPPKITPSIGADNDEVNEGADERENHKQNNIQSVATSSIGAFLSSIPAPKHSATLGTVSLASGSSRRLILETDNTASSVSEVGTVVDAGYSSDHSNELNYDISAWSSGEASLPDYSYYCNFTQNGDLGATPSLGGQSCGTYLSSTNNGADTVDGNAVSNPGADSNVGSYHVVDYPYASSESADFSNYAGYGEYDISYQSNWSDASAALPLESASKFLGKRVRKDAPTQIIEVKQDELMKYRPREDQAKLTGIAFGPSYQPASSKGKPSKLHKRKHQIGSLYFDMKQKESELAERRARGLMTKAQTQGKYGW